ncbi:MAG: PAS domain S-box protein [Syntrophothermus sp.]
MDLLQQNHIIEKNSELYSKFLENAPLGIIIFDKDYKVNFVNDNFFNITSFYHINLNDFIGTDISTIGLLGTNLKKELFELQSGCTVEKEIFYLNENNVALSVILKGSPLVENGNFEGGILVIEDLRVLSDVHKNTFLKSQYVDNVLNTANDGIFVTDTLGIIKYVSGKNIKKFNLDVTQFIDKSVCDALKINQEKFLEDFDKSKNNREVIKGELIFNSNEQEEFFEYKIIPVINNNFKVENIFILFNNISDYFKKIKNLEDENKDLKKYFSILYHLQDSIVGINSEGKIIFWNPSSENLFGYTKNQVFSKNIFTIIENLDQSFFNDIKEELIVKKKTTYTIPFFKGLQKLFLECKFYQFLAANDYVYFLFFSDITYKKKEETELRKSEERFRTIVTHANELICNIRPDGTIIYVNPAFLETLGFHEDEVLYKNIEIFIHKTFLEKNGYELGKFLEGKLEPDLPLESKTGSVFYFLSKFSPIYFGSNTISHYNLFLVNITEKKSTEKDLLIFRSLFEESNEGIAVEHNGRIITCNKALLRILDYVSEEDIIGHKFEEFIDENDKDRISGLLNSSRNKEAIPKSTEFVGIKGDGNKFYSSASFAWFETNDSVYSAIILSDITERKRDQQALRESEEKYRSLTENIDDFLYTLEKVNKKFVPLFYTSSVELITGYNQNEFLNDLKLFLKIIHPEDFPKVKKRMRIIFNGRIHASEEIEFRIINKHGNVKWIRNKSNLVRNNHGEIVKIYGLVSDITLRKKAEEELKNTTTNLLKLNETKDKFISIISHDLRTPFTSILGFTDLLINDETLDNDEKIQYARFIQESSKSMLNLVNSLLDWTRLQTGRIKFEPEKLLINEVIEDSVNALSGASLQKKIKLHSEVPDNIIVFADLSLMQQVFNNLISNAIKFTPKEGKIVVKIVPSIENRFVQLSVEDNGVGISDENINSLFRVETKYTSIGTEGERGSGLGLSLVREIIEKHGGRIWVESELGKGSKFNFTLPVSSPNILLIDSNNTDRILYSKIIKNITSDYNVELCSSGEEALEKITKSTPALIICENILPDMMGYELIKALREKNIKDLPNIIILSSSLDNALITDYNNLGVEYAFSKPVNLRTFKQAVEKSLKKII